MRKKLPVAGAFVKLFALVVAVGVGGCEKKSPVEPKPPESPPAQWRVQIHNLTTHSLSDICASSANSVFVVGDEGKILNFDGTAWS